MLIWFLGICLWTGVNIENKILSFLHALPKFYMHQMKHQSLCEELVNWKLPIWRCLIDFIWTSLPVKNLEENKHRFLFFLFYFEMVLNLHVYIFKLPTTNTL